MSFRYRFIIAFVSIEVFFIFLIVTLNFNTINERVNDYIDKKISSTNILLSELIESPLSVYDLATLDNVIESATNIRDIEYIQISDFQDRVLSSNLNDNKIDFKKYANKNITHKFIDNKHLVIVKKDIKNDDILLGYIYVVYDISDDFLVINENRKKIYFLIFIEIILSTIFAYFIGRNLTLKLLNLSDTALKIGTNDSVKVPYINSSDEIGILATKMNDMQEQINKRNKELKLYEQMFAHTKESIIITDSNRVILDVNQAFIDLTAYNKDEIIGQKAGFIKSNKHSKEFYLNLGKEILKNGSWSGEIIDKKKNGELYTCLLNISSIKDNSGKTSHYIGISSDITKLKEKESILHSQSKMATLGEMLKNIAHQWRQPLSAITSSASSTLVQKDIGVLDDKTLSKNLKTIIKSSNYLSNTIEDFRNFFSEKKEISTFKLKRTIQNAINIIKSNLEINNIKLVLDLDESIDISSSENELIQVLLNIINNSKDALENVSHEKYIFIKLKKANKNVEILVRDNAGGIKDKIIEKIFEPYFTTKHKSQGTGIGLYMTHIIICKHLKGSIKVKNSTFKYKDIKYKGLDFSIKLPNSLVS